VLFPAPGPSSDYAVIRVCGFHGSCWPGTRSWPGWPPSAACSACHGPQSPLQRIMAWPGSAVRAPGPWFPFILPPAATRLPLLTYPNLLGQRLIHHKQMRSGIAPHFWKTENILMKSPSEHKCIPQSSDMGHNVRSVQTTWRKACTPDGFPPPQSGRAPANAQNVGFPQPFTDIRWRQSKKQGRH